MRIAILGAPDSGKETQAILLATRYRVPRISADDLLRKAAAVDGKLDEKTRAQVAAGEPVADEVSLTLLEERLRARDSKRGYIIDGFPANIPQAQALDALLGMLGRGLQISVHIKVDDETLVRSITGRLQCAECDALYNRHHAKPVVRGKCDNCGGKVVSNGRSRGSSKAATTSIQKYHQQATPLLAYYKAQHKLRTVVADVEVEEIWQKICDIVDLEIHPLEVKTLETAAQSHDEEINTVIAGGQISRITAPPEDAVALPPKTTTQKAIAETVNKLANNLASKKKTTSGKAVAKKAIVKKTATTRPVTKIVTKARVKTAVKTKAESNPAQKTTVGKVVAKKSVAKVNIKTGVETKTTSNIAKKKIVTKSPAKKPIAKVNVKTEVETSVETKATSTTAQKTIVKESPEKQPIANNPPVKQSVAKKITSSITKAFSRVIAHTKAATK